MEIDIVEMNGRTGDDILQDLGVESVVLDERARDRILLKDLWVAIEIVDMNHRTGEDILPDLWVEIGQLDECTPAGISPKVP